MFMSEYERHIYNNLRQEMPKRDAEAYIYELREKESGSQYQVLHAPKYGPGARAQIKRERAMEAADRNAEGIPEDPEHPVLRKYVPADCGTETSFLSKAQMQALRTEISERYDIPYNILEQTYLEKDEKRIPEFMDRLSQPDQNAYNMLCRKKTRLDGLYVLLQEDMYGYLNNPFQFVPLAKEIQRKALGE